MIVVAVGNHQCRIVEILRVHGGLHGRVGAGMLLA